MGIKIINPIKAVEGHYLVWSAYSLDFLLSCDRMIERFRPDDASGFVASQTGYLAVHQ